MHNWIYPHIQEVCVKISLESININEINWFRITPLSSNYEMPLIKSQDQATHSTIKIIPNKPPYSVRAFKIFFWQPLSEQIYSIGSDLKAS